MTPRQQLALAQQMIAKEQLRPIELAQAWTVQARSLLEHAIQFCSFHRERIGPIATQRGRVPGPGQPEWQEIPVLERIDVQRHAPQLTALKYPSTHGRSFVCKTSGSAGQPVEVRRTQYAGAMWQVMALRDHLWHRRDSSATFAAIRGNGPKAPPPNGIRMEGWGMPFDVLWPKGAMCLLEPTSDLGQQLQWIERVQPRYLLLHPNNLRGLLGHWDRAHVPSLEQVICIGEIVTDELRVACQRTTGADLIANYSSQEVGYIALQCPDCRQYHVLSDGVFVEVVDEHGRECAVGQMGELLITDLFNYAMPLIRYRIGDYACVGEKYPSRPALPSLKHILGRSRNLLVHADGRKHWPIIGFAKFSSVAPIRQFQVVQLTITEVELRVAADRSLTQSQCQSLADIVRDALGGEFLVNTRQMAFPLPGTKGGKFEEFVSLVS